MFPEDMGVDDPASLGGVYGSNIGQNIGVQAPLFYDAMAAIPAASHTTMWNMSRVSNTMLRNKTAGRFGRNAGGLRQTFSPLRFTSLADVGNIDPIEAGLSRSRGRGGYSPFNFLSRAGNWSVAKAASHSADGAFMGVGKDQRAFSTGAFGRFAAASRTASLNIEKASQLKRIQNSVAAAQRLNPAVGRQVGLGLSRGLTGPTSSFAASVAVGASNSGVLTSRAFGYVQGAQAARQGTAFISALEANAGNNIAYKTAASRGAQAFQAGSFTARVAGSRGLSLAARAAGPVGYALLVADLAGFAGKMAGRTFKLGVEAVQSAQGDLTNRGFGLGYRDNSVAATSRQRGVMAIAGSRMNARSVLGNEAAGLHYSFG